MECFGNECFIINQEARNIVLGTEIIEGNCNNEQVKKLEQKAQDEILKAYTLSKDTCGDGCRCVPKIGVKPGKTQWEKESVEEFTVKDGNCSLTIPNATVETQIISVPGLCKPTKIKVPSTVCIGENVLLASFDPTLLSKEKIKKISKILEQKS